MKSVVSSNRMSEPLCSISRRACGGLSGGQYFAIVASALPLVVRLLPLWGVANVWVKSQWYSMLDESGCQISLPTATLLRMLKKLLR